MSADLRRLLQAGIVAFVVAVPVCVVVSCSVPGPQPLTSMPRQEYDSLPGSNLINPERINTPGEPWDIVTGCWHGLRVFRMGESVSAIADPICESAR